MAPKINEKWFLKSCRRLFHLKSILSQKFILSRKSTRLDEFISAHLCKSSDVKYFVKLIILSACPKKIFCEFAWWRGELLLYCWHLWLWGQRGQNQNFSWITSDTPPTLRRRAGFDSAFFFSFFISEKVRTMPRELKKSKVPKEKTTSSLRALNKTGGWRGLLTYKAWLRNFSSKPWNCQEFNWKR